MRKLLLLLSLITVLGAWADPDFSATKKYHIVCALYTDGCVADGATLGQNTPLYHLPSATTANETYWKFNDVGDGNFTISNVKTRKYITYDGVRQDAPELRRYITMTDEVDGGNSQWYFVYMGDGIYAIRNVEHPEQLWDVRTDSYCVGTYNRPEAANANQQFYIYDQDGNMVNEKQVPEITDNGYDVSSWLVATADSPDGWTFETSDWTDPGFGSYYNGNASVVTPFLEKWTDSNWGTLPDNALRQTIYNLPTGKYILAADIIAVRQPAATWGGSVNEETGKGVYLFAGNDRTEAGTRNEKPQHYTVQFNASSSVTLGIRIERTNANWVATDNFALYFMGTEAELMEGEKAKVKAELSGYYTEAEINQMIAECGNNFDALEALRHSVDNMPAADPLSFGLKNITINKRTLAWAESIDRYLASIPEENFGKDYTATITYNKAEGWNDLTINGTAVPSGSTYKFANVKAVKTYSFMAKKTDGTQSVAKHVTFTALPVVKIYGTFNNEYSDGMIQVIEPGMDSIADVLNMKAKWRGGITNSNGKNKRNYHVKLKDENGDKLEKEFFGLRNDNSWILEACQVDMSRIRNRVLTDLWNDYSTPPYYIGEEKKAKTGSRGQFVELILNDEYRGIYCMTENMDRKQMKLKKYDEETETTHGQLWKSKDWSFATLMGTRPDGSYTPKDYLSEPKAKSETWDRYEVKYPDFEDYGYQTDWSTLYNAVSFVCYADDETFKAEIADYFDLPLVIDYYILMETILATDNHGKNMFFAVYDKEVDKKITFGVWDMDATCGQRWSDSYYHSYIMQPEQDYSEYITYYEHGDYNIFKRLRNTDADDFNMKVRQRYRQLRKGYLDTESILQRFRNYLDLFKLCGADKREYNKWNGNNDIAGLDLDFDNEMEYITDWFTRRMEYLDDVRFDIASLPDDDVYGDVNGDFVVDVADISSILTVMAGNGSGEMTDKADVNNDGTVDVADISSVLTIMAGN